MAVEIPDVKDFDDIEALDKAFKKAIAKADDADETELRIAHANARADFYEIRNKRAALDVAKRDALDRYPLAKEFADDITGRTVEEIEAKAKRMHEKLEQMVGQRTAAQQADEAQELAVPCRRLHIARAVTDKAERAQRRCSCSLVGVDVFEGRLEVPAAHREVAAGEPVQREIPHKQEAAVATFHEMLDRGIYLAPSPFEALFPSLAHGPAEIDEIIAAAADAAAAL